ncbi:IS5 family transposase [Acinetobacter baumannii]|nr:IS5 family transposase [Acinetobacter baumannii]
MNTESKSRYKTTNWSEYNQALRQRGAFTIWFDPQMQWSATPTGKKGRQPTYTDIAIQFALTIRNLFQLALRQTQGFIQSFLQMAHLDWNVPDFSTLSRRADKLQPLLHKSAKNPQEDLHILVDSTGIKVTGDGEWVRKKHGVNQHRQWLKLHLAIGKARNHAVQGCWDKGQKQWKRDIGYHRRSRIEAKMFALKRLGQGVSSRCFNRQVVDLQIRVDILNKFTQLGTAKTVAVA